MEENLKRHIRQSAAVLAIAAGMVYAAGWIKGVYETVTSKDLLEEPDEDLLLEDEGY